MTIEPESTPRGSSGLHDGTDPGDGTDAPPLSRYLQRQAAKVRVFDARRPRVWDLALTGFWTIAALTDAAGGWRNTARDPNVPVWLVVAMSLGFAIPLLWRRSRPMPVLLLMACVALVNSWSGAALQAAYLQLVVVFHVALRLPLRSLALSPALVVPPLVLLAIRHPQGSWDQHVVPTLTTYAMVTLLGIAVRSRKDYTEGLVERARRLEVERDQQARLAAAAERTRIAREMHDIIGHNLSVITGLADGGRYAAARSPERAAQALDAIGTTSREALAELRRLLGVLREDPATGTDAVRDPQPSLADLDTLLAGVTDAGLPVRAVTAGAPGRGTPPLSAGAQLTVYRCVQEALTNTLRHAGAGATASVLLAYGEGELTVEVTDSGTGGPAVPGTGQGLTGMRERAALYDGTLEAGPLPAGGWRILLRLPLEGSLS